MHGGAVAAYSPPHDVTSLWQQTVAGQRSVSPTRKYVAGGPGAVLSPHATGQRQAAYNWWGRPAVSTPPHGAQYGATSPNRSAVTPPHPGIVASPQGVGPVSLSPAHGTLPPPQGGMFPLNPVEPNAPIFIGDTDELHHGSDAASGHHITSATATPARLDSRRSDQPTIERVTIYKEPKESLGFDLAGMQIEGVRSGSPADRQRADVVGKTILKMDDIPVETPQDIYSVSPTLQGKSKVTLTLEKGPPAPVSPQLSRRYSSPTFEDVRPRPSFPDQLSGRQDGNSSPGGLDPTDQVLPPSPARLAGTSAAISNDVDPRNGIPFVRCPVRYEKHFPQLKTAVMYIFEEVNKISHKGKQNPRVLLVLDNCMCLCQMKGDSAKVTRAIPLGSFQGIRIATKGYVGFTLKATADRPQHDLLLQMPSERKARELAEVMEKLVRWRARTDPECRKDIVIENASKLTHTDLNLTKMKTWTYDQQKPSAYTKKETVMNTARRRSAQGIRTQSAHR